MARVVLVRGTQGSGKTTLAGLLGKRLGWRVVSREAFRDAVQAKVGVELSPRGPDAQRAVEDIHGALVVAAERGESLIADNTFPSGVCEENLAMLSKHADLVAIHCQILRRVAMERCADRNGSGTLLAILEARGEDLWERFESPLQCDIPQLGVDTTDGYRPNLEEIVKWI
jgi:predicted kinase